MTDEPKRRREGRKAGPGLPEPVKYLVRWQNAYGEHERPFRSLDEAAKWAPDVDGRVIDPRTGEAPTSV